MGDKLTLGALCVLGAAIVVFVFGPGLVGGFDLACWFLTDTQCTSIVWTEARKAWAILPGAITIAIVVLAGLA